MNLLRAFGGIGSGLLLASATWVMAKPAQPASPSGDKLTLYRDAMGVPHILGDSSAAVMFGVGYSEAQDRLVGLELNRRASQGRRAEILGESMLASDRTARNRQLDAAELMRMYRAIPREHQLMLQAFVDGINHAIAEIEADPEHKTPIEFVQWGIKPTRWTLLDYLGYIASVPNGRAGYELQNMAFLNAMVAKYGETQGRAIFDDVVPISDPDSPLTIPPGEDLAPPQPMPVPTHLSVRPASTDLAAFPAPEAEAQVEASRCLVIGPKKSATGHVLMMEATADGPEAHVQGGGFDSAGFSFVGWGPPTMGRAVQHGWLLTSGHADTNDMFAEKLNPANRYQYWFKGKWETMSHRIETILVKGGPAVQHEVAWTVHGPVVKWDADNNLAYTQRLALRGKELDSWVGIIEMARAKNISDFETKGVNRMGWNLGVCYGGEDGNIAFWEAGALPKRAPGADSRLPTPGTGEYEWTGFLTPAEHPHMLNPKQGYIHTWNSKATSWSREGDDARIGATYRTWLGSRLAASNDKITLLDMREFNRKMFNALGARDRTQTTPDFFAPYIRAALAKTDDAEVRQAGELMLSFNGLYEDLNGDGRYDNPGLTLFRTWLTIAPDVVFSQSIGDWWRKVDEGRYHRYQTSLLLRAFQGKDAGAPLTFDYFGKRDRDQVMIETIRRTIDKVKAGYPGKPMSEWRLPIFWKYYDPSKITPDRPSLTGEDEGGKARTSAALGLGPAMVPHNGGEGWVGLMEVSPDIHTLYSVTELGGQNQFISPDGAGNPHLVDQTMMHVQSQFKKTEMAPDAVRATAVSSQQLIYTPGKVR